MHLEFQGAETILQAGDIALVYVEPKGLDGSKFSVLHIYFERDGKDLQIVAEDENTHIALLGSPDQPNAVMHIVAACSGLKNEKLSTTDLENYRFVFEKTRG